MSDDPADANDAHDGESIDGGRNGQTGDGEIGTPTDHDVPTDYNEGDAPLAAVVEKRRTEIAIESLRTEGVYDDDRRIREYAPAGEDGEYVALPVTAPPAETRVREVVRQVDPEPRNRDLADLLADRDWSDDDLEYAPKSWAVIGSVVLVTIPDGCPDEGVVGEALLEIHGEADSVLADEGIANEGDAGTYRTPKTRVIAGDTDTETVHSEHGTRYGLDPAKVMFSPGNQAERVRMGEVVEAGERVFDMFAGIGYFALPMARAGARVTAAEINPIAFRYLLENAVLNDVADRVDAYRADCREIADEVDADRVVMGYYGTSGADGAGERGATEETDGTDESDGGDESSDGDESDGTTGNGDATAGSGRADEGHEYLDAALAALEPEGVIHYHEATPEPLLWERPIERLEAAVERDGRSIDPLEKRRVKSHSAGVWHVVIDARIG